MKPHINGIVPRHPDPGALLPHVRGSLVCVDDLLSFLHVLHQGSKEVTFLRSVV